MAKLVVEIPDEHYERVIEAMCALYGYREYLVTPATPDLPEKVQPNPESPTAFTSRMIGEYVENSLKSHEVNKATEAARLQAHETASNVKLAARLEG